MRLTKKAKNILRKKYVKYLLSDIESLKEEIKQNPKSRTKNHHNLTNRQDLKLCTDLLKNMHVFDMVLNAYQEKYNNQNKINSFYSLFKASEHFDTEKEMTGLYCVGAGAVVGCGRSRFSSYAIDCFFVEINNHHARIIYKKHWDKK